MATQNGYLGALPAEAKIYAMPDGRIIAEIVVDGNMLVDCQVRGHHWRRAVLRALGVQAYAVRADLGREPSTRMASDGSDW